MKSEGFTGQFGADDEVAERYVTILHPRTGTLLAANVSIAAESAEGLAQGRSCTTRHGRPRPAGPTSAPSGPAAAGAATARSREHGENPNPAIGRQQA
ncbi:hypothetical protein [Nonomuraea dietziae]|uniref:hypothetical protein n=1 Tax=Nonomuraea dietziae TaxID=65515 RepID=UPI0031DE6E00